MPVPTVVPSVKSRRVNATFSRFAAAAEADADAAGTAAAPLVDPPVTAESLRLTVPLEAALLPPLPAPTPPEPMRKLRVAAKEEEPVAPLPLPEVVPAALPLLLDAAAVLLPPAARMLAPPGEVTVDDDVP